MKTGKILILGTVIAIIITITVALINRPSEYQRAQGTIIYNICMNQFNAPKTCECTKKCLLKTIDNDDSEKTAYHKGYVCGYTCAKKYMRK